MAEPIPPLTVTLSWDSEMEFTAQAGKHEIGLDGSQHAAPSPMQMLALSIAGCMAIDLVHIIQRSRKTLKSLDARFTGERSAEEPKRFLSIHLQFALTTDATPEQVERAIELSREKYCSVWSSMRQDIDLKVDYTIEP
jgi:putative redox protein